MVKRVYQLLSNFTVDGWNPAPPGMQINPCKQWDKLPTSTGERRISAINSRVGIAWSSDANYQLHKSHYQLHKSHYQLHKSHYQLHRCTQKIAFRFNGDYCNVLVWFLCLPENIQGKHVLKLFQKIDEYWFWNVSKLQGERCWLNRALNHYNIIISYIAT